MSQGKGKFWVQKFQNNRQSERYQTDLAALVVDIKQNGFLVGTSSGKTIEISIPTVGARIESLTFNCMYSTGTVTVLSEKYDSMRALRASPSSLFLSSDLLNNMSHIQEQRLLSPSQRTALVDLNYEKVRVLFQFRSSTLLISDFCSETLGPWDGSLISRWIIFILEDGSTLMTNANLCWISTSVTLISLWQEFQCSTSEWAIRMGRSTSFVLISTLLMLETYKCR